MAHAHLLAIVDEYHKLFSSNSASTSLYSRHEPKASMCPQLKIPYRPEHPHESEGFM